MKDEDKGTNHEEMPDEEIDVSLDDVPDEAKVVSKQEFDKAAKKADEAFDRLQRLQAEFDNYRKRMDSRFGEITKYAAESILLRVLDVYDNLERALQVDFKADPESARKGIEAIKKQFDKILEQESVRPIESLDEPFDPYYMHSVERITDSEKTDGTVVAEYQKGYMLRERVLRPALVCVSRKDEDATANETDGDQESVLTEGE